MRTFVAIDLSDAVLAALKTLQKNLRQAFTQTGVEGPGGRIRWTRPEGIHLTLQFLGEISAHQANAVIAALQAMPPAPPFEVEVRGLGVFPNPRRARVLWAGVEAPPPLEALAHLVQQALAPAGFTPEERDFKPHLTLARFDSPPKTEPLKALLQENSSAAFGSFTASRFFLYQSVLGSGAAAEYRKLQGFDLGVKRESQST